MKLIQSIAIITSALGFLLQSETGVQAQDNSCSNVSIIGAFDRSGFIEESDSIYAVGTFRVENENDEDKQPFFNLTTIACRKNNYITICNVTRATMYAQSAAPNTKVPNCELDLDATEYILKETTSGMLTGVAESGICYNSILSLDRKSRKIYMSFTKTEAAYSAESDKLGLCKNIPRTQVLMNCTPWAALRKGTTSSSRYCDFSSANDKKK